jgi:biopolymer transport protein ExbD
MVTLIGFLLFTTSFLAMVSIESLLPQASPEQVQEKIKEKPLQLTVTVRDDDVQLWSPFQKFPDKFVANLPDGTLDTKSIHDAAIEIKKLFPIEETVVLAPKRGTAYENLILIMDAMRNIDPTDPPLYHKNVQSGVDEPTKSLFPKVVFGNLLGDT